MFIVTSTIKLKILFNQSFLIKIRKLLLTIEKYNILCVTIPYSKKELITPINYVILMSDVNKDLCIIYTTNKR